MRLRLSTTTLFVCSLLLALPALARPNSAGLPSDQTVMVRAVGYHRNSDSAIWVWAGNRNKLGTLTHELLHRKTLPVRRELRADLVRLTGDPKFNEGLTSYFTARALERSGRQAGFPDPAPGSSFGELRAWSRSIREQARATLHEGLGLEIDTRHVMIASNRIFGRAYARDFGKPWESHPGQPGSYGNSKSRVQQLVDVVGEEPVRRAYFEGDAVGLRQALGAAAVRAPGSLPSWLNLN